MGSVDTLFGMFITSVTNIQIDIFATLMTLFNGTVGSSYLEN